MVRGAPLHNAKTMLPKKNLTIQDNRISVCAICRKGIFNFHEYEWSGDGLIHTGKDLCTDGGDE